MGAGAGWRWGEGLDFGGASPHHPPQPELGVARLERGLAFEPDLFPPQ